MVVAVFTTLGKVAILRQRRRAARSRARVGLADVGRGDRRASRSCSCTASGSLSAWGDRGHGRERLRRCARGAGALRARPRGRSRCAAATSTSANLARRPGRARASSTCSILRRCAPGSRAATRWCTPPPATRSGCRTRASSTGSTSTARATCWRPRARRAVASWCTPAPGATLGADVARAPGHYRASKAQGEALVLRAAAEGLPAVVVHPTTVLGPATAGRRRRAR